MLTVWSKQIVRCSDLYGIVQPDIGVRFLAAKDFYPPQNIYAGSGYHSASN